MSNLKIRYIIYLFLIVPILGCNNNECGFNLEDILSGDNSEDINFIWNCSTISNHLESDAFTLLLFKNGTGISDSASQFNWERTGCRSFSYESDTFMAEMINLELVDDTLTGEQITEDTTPFVCEKNPIVNISRNTTFSGRPSIATDEEDNIHVVWYELFPNAFEIFYSTLTDKSTWSLPVQISQGEGLSTHPVIAIDNEKTLHVVWMAGRVMGIVGEFEIFYSNKKINGEWSIPINISNSLGQSTSPDIVADELGNIHVVWQDDGFTTGIQDDIFYIMTMDGITWSSPTNISDNDGDSTHPKIDVGQGGDLHVIWSNYGVYYSTKINGEEWSRPMYIPSTFGEFNAGDIVVKSDDNIHVVLTDSLENNNPDIFYTFKSSMGAWSYLFNVSNNSGQSDIPHLTTDESGNLHLVWIDDTITFFNPLGNSDVFYSFKPYNTDIENWTLPTNISRSGGESISPSISTNSIDIVWQDNLTSNNEIFYRGTIVTTPILLSPKEDEKIQQNRPDIGCPFSPIYGYGFRIFFDWTDSSSPNGIRGYHLFAKNINAIIPIIDRFVLESEFTYNSCNSYVGEGNLNNWIWNVQAEDNNGNLSLAAEGVFMFEPLQVPVGASTNAPSP